MTFVLKSCQTSIPVFEHRTVEAPRFRRREYADPATAPVVLLLRVSHHPEEKQEGNGPLALDLREIGL